MQFSLLHIIFHFFILGFIERSFLPLTESLYCPEAVDVRRDWGREAGPPRGVSSSPSPQLAAPGPPPPPLLESQESCPEDRRRPYEKSKWVFFLSCEGSNHYDIASS